MSLKKIATSAWGNQPYKGWEVNFLKDEKTIRITKGKESHDFQGQSVTLEYHQGEAIAAAYKYIIGKEQEVAHQELQDFAMLAVMIKQAQDQAKMIEGKFTKMDKQKLNIFLNSCNGLIKGLEMRMDNGPKVFEDQSYMILEFMREVNEVGLRALLDGHGDDFQTLLEVYKNRFEKDKSD